MQCQLNDKDACRQFDSSHIYDALGHAYDTF